jgi:hypothetical protein
MGETKLGS